MADPPLPPVRIVGANPTPIWGMTSAERIRRITAKAGLPIAAGDTRSDPLLAIADAFCFDPQWIGFMLRRPGSVLTLAGRPVMALGDAEAAVAALEGGGSLPPIAAEDHATVYNAALRKREAPFLLPLDPGTVRAIEQASYRGAYKGVTDLLTKYLWPGLAFVLTRWAARARITPNMVTIAGILLCVVAAIAFWRGAYWSGVAAGFVFMVLDTVDGKLARCTVTSSRLGDVLDHGVDLVHPLFWWWAWAHGLGAWGLALGPHRFALVMATMVAGYVVQRAIEGAFIWRFAMHIHVWRRFDSRFRLVTARRNPNMVILVASLLVRRPDLGIVSVAWWTALSCLVHLARLGQAELRRARGRPITSWLEEAA